MTFRSQVLLKPGLLLPQEVERGGDFYLTAMVEHVQGEQEEVEYTEQGQVENTANKVKLKILKLRIREAWLMKILKVTKV